MSLYTYPSDTSTTSTTSTTINVPFPLVDPLVPPTTSIPPPQNVSPVTEVGAFPIPDTPTPLPVFTPLHSATLPVEEVTVNMLPPPEPTPIPAECSATEPCLKNCPVALKSTYGDLTVNGNLYTTGDTTIDGTTTTVGDLKLKKRVLADDGSVLIDPKTLSSAFTTIQATTFSEGSSSTDYVTFSQTGLIVENTATADQYNNTITATTGFTQTISCGSLQNFNNMIVLDDTTSYVMQEITVGGYTILAFVKQ